MKCADFLGSLIRPTVLALRFSQLCYRGFVYSGLWHRVFWYEISEVSKDRSSKKIFALQDKVVTTISNIGHHIPHTTHHVTPHTTPYITYHTPHITHHIPHTQRHSIKSQKTRTLGSVCVCCLVVVQERRRFWNRISSTDSHPKASKYESGRGHGCSYSHCPRAGPKHIRRWWRRTQRIRKRAALLYTAQTCLSYLGQSV